MQTAQQLTTVRGDGAVVKPTAASEFGQGLTWYQFHQLPAQGSPGLGAPGENLRHADALSSGERHQRLLSAHVVVPGAISSGAEEQLPASDRDAVGEMVASTAKWRELVGCRTEGIQDSGTRSGDDRVVGILGGSITDAAFSGRQWAIAFPIISVVAHIRSARCVWQSGPAPARRRRLPLPPGSRGGWRSKPSRPREYASADDADDEIASG